jgi:hypothetical protein
MSRPPAPFGSATSPLPRARSSDFGLPFDAPRAVLHDTSAAHDAGAPFCPEHDE